MERRKALKNIGISFGAVVATPSVLSLLQSCQAQETPWLPQFFNEEQGKFVRRIVDNILPSSGDLPSATDVNVHVFIDKFMQEVITVDDKPNAREMVTVAMQTLMESAGATSIDDVKESNYVDFLTNNLKKSKEEEAQLMGKVYAYLGENNNNLKGMEPSLVAFQFLSQIRSMSIWAYKNSELVGETILAYVPVPGQQQGCIDVQEATGGKAYSLNWG